MPLPFQVLGIEDIEAPAAPAAPERGDFSRGFGRAWAQLPELGYGTAAMAANSAEALFGEGGISTAAKNYFTGKFLERQEANKEYAPSVEWTDAWDRLNQGELGPVMDWLQDTAGYVVGQGIQTVGTGLIGGLVGKTALRAGTEKLLGGMVARQADKLVAEAIAEKGLQGAAAEAAKAQLMPEAAKIAAGRVAAGIGAGVTLNAQNLGMEAGDIYGGLLEESKRTGKAISGDDLARAWGWAAAAAGTETATDLLGLGALTGKVKIPGGKGRAARGLMAAGIGAPVEGGTEYAQTWMEQRGAGQDTDTPEARKERINAAAMGALGGTLMGGGAGVLAPVNVERQTQDTKDAATRIMGSETVDQAIAQAEASVDGRADRIQAERERLMAMREGMVLRAAKNEDLAREADAADLAQLVGAEQSDLAFRRRALLDEQQKQRDLDALQAESRDVLGRNPEQQVAAAAAATDEEPTAMELAFRNAKSLRQSARQPAQPQAEPTSAQEDAPPQAHDVSVSQDKNGHLIIDPDGKGQKASPEAAPGQSAQQPTEETGRGQRQETPEVLNVAGAGEQSAPAEETAYSKGKAVVFARRMTVQGLPSEAYPHPTKPGMWAIRPAGEAQPGEQAEPPAVEVPASRPARRKSSSTLLQAIINRGGIDRSIMSDVGGDRGARYAPGVFTNNGHTDLSLLAEYLVNEDGFNQIDLNREDDQRGAQQLADLIARAIHGERILSSEAMAAEAGQGEERQYRMQVRQEAERLGIKYVGRPFSRVEEEVHAARERRNAEEVAALAEQERQAYDEVIDVLRILTDSDNASDVKEAMFEKLNKEGIGDAQFYRLARAEVEKLIDDLGLRSAEDLDAEIAAARELERQNNEIRPVEDLPQPDAESAEPRQETGRGNGRPGTEPEAARPAFDLEGQTEEQVRAELDAREAEAERQRAEEAKAAEAERKAREAKEIEDRAKRGVGADFFTLDAQVNNQAEQRKADAKRADAQLAGQGDVFSAPASPPAEEIPEAVRKRVSGALDSLREVARAIADAKSLEDRVGQAGRYQADTLENRKGNIESAQEVLRKFRELAAGKGIDAQAFIDGLGGVPDLTPSKEAQEWLDAPGRGGVEDGAAKDDGDIESRIAEAEASGIVLSDADKAKIRESYAKAAELRKRANGLGNADPMNKGNAFPMGVGYTKMTKRAEQRIDASVRRAGEAAKLYDQADIAQKYADALLAGKETEADNARKKEKRVEAQRNLIDRLLKWKKGDKIGAFTIERVNFDADGYPSTYTISGDGIVKGVMDKVDVAREFFGGDKAKVRALVDEIREDSLPAGEQEQDPIARHDAFLKRLYDGAVTMDEFKAAFRSVTQNEAAIKAALGAMTKDKILALLPSHKAYRYKGEKKDDVIGAAFDDMVSDFSMGRSISYVMGPNMRGGYRNAVAEMVEKTTEDDLKKFAAEIAEAREGNAARRKQIEEAAKDPKTLDDFRTYLRIKMADGMSGEEARRSLTPDQRATFDDLLAEESRGQRNDRTEQERTRVQAATVTTSGQVIETKHTKTGEPLFVVKAAERVEREVYNHWNATAKRLGGWYSSYRGGGAVPGFQFKTRENADAFLKFLGGDTGQAQEAVQSRRDAFQDDRSQSAAERLTEMADALAERADESLGMERKENTERRARMAASAETAARSDKALAQTMRNIAMAIETKTTKFLDRVRQKTQVEMLREILGIARAAELRARFPSYADQEKHRYIPASKETADYAEFPKFEFYRSDLASLGRRLLEIDGAKKLGQRLLSVADDVTDAYLAFAKENLYKVSTFSRWDGQRAVFSSRDDAEAAIARSGFKGKAIVLPFKRGQNIIIMSPSAAQEKGLWAGDPDKRITLTRDFGMELAQKHKEWGKKSPVPWYFGVVAERLGRLKGIGIETPAELRAALREFVTLQQTAAPPDKIKELERKMVGRRQDGLDFFPTPTDTAQRLVETARVEEGMAVLEPSAGMGHIADAIREAGAEPDVVEMSGDRRELLEAKGYNLVGSDFMDLEPRTFFTFGDVFKAPDGTVGVMQGGGGLGSNRVKISPLDAQGVPDRRVAQWHDRDSLEPVEKRGLESGYDRIIMNPPFSNRRDAEHVRHAYDLLRPGGRLVAIMSEGTFLGQDRKAQEFRDWLDSVDGTSEKLDEGTFMDASLPVNTGVNARMVVIDKPSSAMLSRSDSAADFALESLGDALINHEAQIVIAGEIPTASVPNVRAARLYNAEGEHEGNAAVIYRDGKIPMLVDIRMFAPQTGTGEKYVRAMVAAAGENGLFLYDIQEQAEGFWTKMGAIPENLGGELAHGNGFLFWSDYAGQRSAQVDAARPAQDQAPGRGDAQDGADFLGRREAPLERGHDGRIHAEDLSAVAAEFRQVFPGLPILPVERESQLPPELQKAIKELGAKGDTAAAFHEDAVWLVRSGIHSLQHARRIIPHEATHAGLDWLLGPAKDRLLLDIHRANPSVAAKAKDIAARYRYSMVRATEEVLADMGPQVKALKGWNKLVAWVRRQFRKLGWVQEWTDRDVEDLVLQALARAKNGPGAPFGVSRGSAFSRADFASGVRGTIADSVAGRRLSMAPVHVMDHTPATLRAFGWGDLSVSMNPKEIDKAHFDHGMTADRIASLVPDTLENPSLMLRSATQEGNMVMVANEYGSKPVLLVVKPNVDTRVGKRQLVVSMYPKDEGWNWVARQIRNGNLLYRDPGSVVAPRIVGAVTDAQKKFAQAGRPMTGLIPEIGAARESPGNLSDGYKVLLPSDLRKTIEEVPNDLSAPDSGGTSSADNPDISLSRTSQAIDLAADVLDTIAQPSAKSFGMLKGLQTQLHKARTVPAYARVFRLAMAFRNDLSRAAFRPWENAKDILPAYDDIKGAWNALLHGKKQSADITAAGKFLFEGTMYGGGNPLSGLLFSDAKLKSMGATDEQIRLYHQARDAIDASLDEMSAAVAWKLAKRYLHPAAKYSAINDPAGAKDAFLQLLEVSRKAAEDQVGYPTPEAAQAAEKEIAATMKAVEGVFDHAEALKAAGYAPLMRFGRYTVDVFETDGNGKVKGDRLEFRTYETEIEAKAGEKELRKAYANQPGVVIQRGVKGEETGMFAGVDPETVALFAKQVADIPGIDIDKAVLDEYYRQSVSERSALTRTIKRKGIAGYSEDLPRVLASFLTSNARYVSSTWHMGDMREEIQSIRDAKIHGDVADEAQKLYDYINGTQEPGAAIRGAMFAWYLGGSPAAAAINLTQPLLMTWPYLSQFGTMKAAKMLTASVASAINPKLVPAGIRAALRRAQEEGIVEAQEIHHLYQEGMRPILSRLPGGESMRARAQGAAALWGSLFGMAENFNRRITFLAAYKMAAQDQALIRKFGSAYEFARRAVEETQGIYAKENRPDWARGTGPLGAVGVAAFTFKQYSIQYVELLSRMWKSGPEGKKAAGLMLGILILASGLQGIPFADDLEDLIDTLIQSFGYRGNSKKAMRDTLRNAAGEHLADLVMYGFSADTPIDVQARLGLGNMVPATALFKPSEQGKASQLAELVGPPGGMAKQVGDFVDAVQSGKQGDAFKAFSPKMVQDTMKAWQMWDTGEYRDSRGRKVTEVSGADTAIKLSGFQPQSVAEKTRRDRMIQQDISRVRGLEADIASLWTEGILDKEPEKVSRAREMLADWNSRNPDTPIRVTSQQILSRVKQSRMDREQRMTKAAPKEMRGYVADGTR